MHRGRRTHRGTEVGGTEMHGGGRGRAKKHTSLTDGETDRCTHRKMFLLRWCPAHL